ncbi:rhomboid family intramembrane serine protease [Mycetocola reblochoni]|uniref:Rhomboid family serine protease n=2 Tax=Mycetocola reblochoni TaxID=331618 RepID=A0A1R4JFE6_9MICO|nr:rhomboid family intramembrane serine protease [Mycetocola reblochoni]SJN30830.1 rhomboid family serine protease [Mycetocola reblochoni REB411]
MREQKQNAPRRPNVLTRLSRSDRPMVTTIIIAVTAFVWVLQILPGIGGVVTDSLLYAGVYSHPGYFEPWRMLTVLLTHSTNGFYGLLHIGLNMYMLWVLGSMLEPAIGRGRFLVLYLFAGFSGSLGVMFLTDPLTATVGASGAVFGLLGALIVIQRRIGGNTSGLIVLVAVNFAIGFLGSGNVSWQAHLGGLIGGAAVGAIYASTRQRSDATKQRLLLGVLAAVLVLLSLWNLLFATA